MDPISAMAFSLIVSWVAVKAGWEAGVDQAKAEARHTADVIRKDLHARRKAWAKQLEKRLADGRRGGPATALWWGWAAMRTAKAVRRMMRREPRAAEKAIKGPVGPFRRVFNAAWRGAQYARDEARRRREAHEKQSPREPVGVCGRCGAIAAKSALVWALTRFGRQERMCAKCRADIAAQRKADEEAARAAEDEPTEEPIDAEPGVVHDSDDYTVPGSAGGDESTTPPYDEQTSAPPPRQPAPPTVKVERIYETPQAQPALGAGEPAAVNAAPEGEEMPRQLTPARGGVIATRNTAMTRRGGGDSYTHGAWNRATRDIERRLEMLPALLEQMLASLTHADAGRTQVAGVVAFHQGAHIFIGQLREMLREVNRRENPVVETVTAAGGPEEIPSINYLREV